MCEEEIQELFKMPLAIAHLKVVTVRTGAESSPNCKQSETMEFRDRKSRKKEPHLLKHLSSAASSDIARWETYFSIHHTQKLCPSLQEHNSSRWKIKKKVNQIEVVAASGSLEVSKARLEEAWSNLVWWQMSLLVAGGGTGGALRSLHPKPVRDSMIKGWNLHLCQKLKYMEGCFIQI